MHIPAVHMSAISEENLSQAFKPRKSVAIAFLGSPKVLAGNALADKSVVTCNRLVIFAISHLSQLSKLPLSD